jgi:hypothetical protein
MTQKVTKEELIAKARKPAADALIMQPYYMARCRPFPVHCPRL